MASVNGQDYFLGRCFLGRFWLGRFWPTFGASTIVSGPFDVQAADIFVPGMSRGEVFVPGASRSEVFVPGSIAAGVDS